MLVFSIFVTFDFFFSGQLLQQRPGAGLVLISKGPVVKFIFLETSAGFS